MTSQNMRAIQTVTVGAGGASTIDFNSIPQTYTDLRILVSGRMSGTNETVQIRFNSDTTGTNYRRLELFGSASAVGTRNVNDNGIGYVSISLDGSNIFGNLEIYIPNYRSSNAKTYMSYSTREANSTSAYIIATNTLSYSGTSAISSISLVPQGTFVQHTTATLYGISSTVAAGAKASGGAVFFDSTHVYHVFTASGTFTPTQNLTTEALVIAGGGAGGGNFGGGGGAGGLCYHSNKSVLASTNYTVTIGAGATAGNPYSATDGSNTVFDNITANGGGGGGGSDTGTNMGRAGGSGGGGNRTNVGGSATQGSSGGATGFGNAGGSAANGFQAGGGGGAGAVGANGSGTTDGTSKGGNGGAGLNTWSSWASATGTGVGGFYAGGGGGAGRTGNENGGGEGGAGGGGFGGKGLAVGGTAGIQNTGSGGGAGTDDVAATGNGGSGIVIIRYAK